MKNKQFIIFFIILVVAIIGVCIYQGVNQDNILKNQTDSNVNTSNEFSSNSVDNQIDDIVEENLDSSKPLKIHAQLDDGRCWGQLAIENSGNILGFTQMENDKPSELFLYNINNSEVKPFYTLEPNWSPAPAQINDNFILWEEYLTEESDLRPMRIMLYNRDTNEVTKIHEDLNYNKNLPFIRTCLGEDTAYWSTGYFKDDTIIHCIMKYDILSKEKCLYKDMATAPAINDNHFIWLGPEDDTLTNTAAFQENLDTKEITRITSSKSPNHIVGSDERVIFSGLDKPSSYDKNIKDVWSICLYEDGIITKIRTSSGSDDIFEFPQFNGKFVGWRGTDKLRLYSVDEKKSYILTDKCANYTEVTLCDNYALWNSPVIDDEKKAKEDAMERGMYDSYIYILPLDDM
ncbi:hypothetical protein [Clostridium sp.]|uniref:hypothetical protein n=1 Tax=Clostridium sp. TaxID=1506 RepID=UPI0032166601